MWHWNPNIHTHTHAVCELPNPQHHIPASGNWNQLWQIHIFHPPNWAGHQKRGPITSSSVWWDLELRVDSEAIITDWQKESVSSCWAWWSGAQSDITWGPHRDQNLKSWKSENGFQVIHLRPGNECWSLTAWAVNRPRWQLPLFFFVEHFDR